MNFLIQSRLNLDFDGFNKDNFNQTHIVESIALKVNSTPMKCFTIFSHLNKMYRVIKSNMKQLQIELNRDNEVVLFGSFPKIIVSIHSPNTLPDISEGGTISFWAGSKIFLNYNQIKTELLDNSYDTNCYEYDLDYKFANFNMRSDCISSCIQNVFTQECNQYNLISTGYPLRKELLEQNLYFNSYQAENNYECIKTTQTEANTICMNKCKPDCTYTYYLFNKDDVHEVVPPNTIRIFVKHNSMPDILIKHLPQTTFLSLVCNFGGLLGMWLGLSFFTILNKLFFLIKHFIIKIIIVNNSENHIHIHNVNQQKIILVRPSRIQTPQIS